MGYLELREDNYVQTTYTELPSNAPGLNQTAVQVKLVKRLSRRKSKETAMCAISLHLTDPQGGLVLPD